MTQPAAPPSAAAAPSRGWGRFDLAMVALGLVANAFLALALLPVLSLEELHVDDLGIWWRTTGAMVLLVPLLAVAAWSAWRRTVRSQIVARAISWSNLVVGTLLAVTYPLPRDRALGAGIAVGCALALLALGNDDLQHRRRRDPFAPARFRGLLLLALVMAFADAQTLALTAVLRVPLGADPMHMADALWRTTPVMVAAAVMMVAVWGLYRLSTWALLLNLLANLVIASLALGGLLGVSMPVAIALASTAAIQALLPLPILAVALGRRGPRLVERLAVGRLVPLGVLAVGGLAVTFALGDGQRSGWHDGTDEAFLRGMRRSPQGACFMMGRPSPTLDLRRLDLPGLVLDDLCLGYADLRGANLRGAHGLAHWGEADLSDADLRGADLRGSKFEGWMTDADFRGADLTETTWDGLDLRKTLFGIDARLRGADLGESDLRGVSLVGADLRDAELRGTLFVRADLRGADLRGAKLPSLSPSEARTIHWEGTLCPDGTLAEGDEGCLLRRAHMPVELLDRRMTRKTSKAWSQWVCPIPDGMPGSDLHEFWFGTGAFVTLFGREWTSVSPLRYRANGSDVELRVRSTSDGLAVVIYDPRCGRIHLAPAISRHY